MTANGNLKRRVRARAAKTGESYTTALRHFRASPRGDEMPEFDRLRIAVAQTTVHDDPTSGAELRAAGTEIREVMRDARRAGARLLHLTEGATCFPSKHVMSSFEEVGPADWTRFDWDVLDGELTAIAELAKRLGLWTVFGSVHRRADGSRPHNSLYVVSDAGRIVARYDERTLSHTKRTYMYTPGTDPVTFEDRRCAVRVCARDGLALHRAVRRVRPARRRRRADLVDRWCAVQQRDRRRGVGERRDPWLLDESLPCPRSTAPSYRPGSCRPRVTGPRGARPTARWRSSPRRSNRPTGWRGPGGARRGRRCSTADPRSCSVW